MKNKRLIRTFNEELPAAAAAVCERETCCSDTFQSCPHPLRHAERIPPSPRTALAAAFTACEIPLYGRILLSEIRNHGPAASGRRSASNVPEGIVIFCQ